MYTGQYISAFPDAKVYIPNRTAESWAKDKKKEHLIPRIAHTFGKGLGDPFSTLTNGEIQTADWGAAHANEVRSTTDCPPLAPLAFRPLANAPFTLLLPPSSLLLSV